MVDVISTRLQEVYGSWRLPGFPSGSGTDGPEERLTTTALRRFGDEHRRRKAYIKDAEKKVRNYLLGIKVFFDRQLNALRLFLLLQSYCFII